MASEPAPIYDGAALPSGGIGTLVKSVRRQTAVAATPLVELPGRRRTRMSSEVTLKSDVLKKAQAPAHDKADLVVVGADATVLEVTKVRGFDHVITVR